MDQLNLLGGSRSPGCQDMPRTCHHQIHLSFKIPCQLLCVDVESSLYSVSSSHALFSFGRMLYACRKQPTFSSCVRISFSAFYNTLNTKIMHTWSHFDVAHNKRVYDSVNDSNNNIDDNEERRFLWNMKQNMMRKNRTHTHAPEMKHFQRWKRKWIHV